MKSRQSRFAAACLLMLASILVSSAVTAEEWWHGSFVPTRSAIEPDPFEVLDCYEAPDTMVTYASREISRFSSTQILDFVKQKVKSR